jgi:hypothetical protein
VGNLEHGTIEQTTPGVFKIPSITFEVDSPGKYYIVVNVRGVETKFTHQDAELVVHKQQTKFELAIEILEGVIAFIVSISIIMFASYSFPFYLYPLCFIIISLFVFYVSGTQN